MKPSEQFGAGGGGWGDFGSYLRDKNVKMLKQVQEIVPQIKSNLFSNVIAFFNGRTKTPIDLLKTMLVENGGKFSQYDMKTVTHVVVDSISMGNLKWRNIHKQHKKTKHYVTSEWITQSIESQRLLNPNLFLPPQLRHENTLHSFMFDPFPDSSRLPEYSSIAAKTIESEEEVEEVMVSSYLTPGKRPREESFAPFQTSNTKYYQPEGLSSSETGEELGLVRHPTESIETPLLLRGETLKLEKSTESYRGSVETTPQNQEQQETPSVRIGEDILKQRVEKETLETLNESHSVTMERMRFPRTSSILLDDIEFFFDTPFIPPLPRNEVKVERMEPERKMECLFSISHLDSPEKLKDYQKRDSALVASPFKDLENAEEEVFVATSPKDQRFVRVSQEVVNSRVPGNGAQANSIVSPQQHLVQQPLDRAMEEEWKYELEVGSDFEMNDAEWEEKGVPGVEGKVPEINRRSLGMGNRTRRPKTANDANFVESYFQNSRLHLLGVAHQKIIDEIGELIVPASKIDDNEVTQFQEAIKILGLNPSKFTSLFPNFAFTVADKKEPEKLIRKFVVHLDFDFFFVAVSLRNRPALHNSPVAVAHGTSVTSRTSEICSANYIARSFGIRAGMFVGEAMILCDNLTVLPYNFEEIHKISRMMYQNLLRYTKEVVPVGIDETYAILVGEKDQIIMNLLNLRREIFEETQCTVSIGMSCNFLGAKLGSKNAKPTSIPYRCFSQSEIEGKKWGDMVGHNKGVFYCGHPAEILSNDTGVRTLPGIGRRTHQSLTSDNLMTCGDIRRASLERIKKVLGDKKGWKFYLMAFGVDTTEGVSIFDSKSVTGQKKGDKKKNISVSVRWGIRFETRENVIGFLQQLARECTQRLFAIRSSCRNLSYRIMRAVPGEWSAAKFLGHGRAIEFSTSRYPVKNSPTGAKNFDNLMTQILDAMKILWDREVEPKCPIAEVRGVSVNLHDIAQPEQASIITALFAGDKVKKKDIVTLDTASSRAIPLQLPATNIPNEINSPSESIDISPSIPDAPGNPVEIVQSLTSAAVTSLPIEEPIRPNPIIISVPHTPSPLIPSSPTPSSASAPKTIPLPLTLPSHNHSPSSSRASPLKPEKNKRARSVVKDLSPQQKKSHFGPIKQFFTSPYKKTSSIIDIESDVELVTPSLRTTKSANAVPDERREAKLSEQQFGMRHSLQIFTDAGKSLAGTKEKVVLSEGEDQGVKDVDRKRNIDSVTGLSFIWRSMTGDALSLTEPFTLKGETEAAEEDGQNKAPKTKTYEEKIKSNDEDRKDKGMETTKNRKKNIYYAKTKAIDDFPPPMVVPTILFDEVSPSRLRAAIREVQQLREGQKIVSESETETDAEEGFYSNSIEIKIPPSEEFEQLERERDHFKNDRFQGKRGESNQQPLRKDVLTEMALRDSNKAHTDILSSVEQQRTISPLMNSETETPIVDWNNRRVRESSYVSISSKFQQLDSEWSSKKPPSPSLLDILNTRRKSYAQLDSLTQKRPSIDEVRIFNIPEATREQLPLMTPIRLPRDNYFAGQVLSPSPPPSIIDISPSYSQSQYGVRRRKTLKRQSIVPNNVPVRNKRKSCHMQFEERSIYCPRCLDKTGFTHDHTKYLIEKYPLHHGFCQEWLNSTMGPSMTVKVNEPKPRKRKSTKGLLSQAGVSQRNARKRKGKIISFLDFKKLRTGTTIDISDHSQLLVNKAFNPASLVYYQEKERREADIESDTYDQREGREKREEKGMTQAIPNLCGIPMECLGCFTYLVLCIHQKMYFYPKGLLSEVIKAFLMGITDSSCRAELLSRLQDLLSERNESALAMLVAKAWS